VEVLYLDVSLKFNASDVKYKCLSLAQQMWHEMAPLQHASLVHRRSQCPLFDH